MELLDVICGIIINENKVLVAQRSMYMSLPLKWEFPGGKKNVNESDVECLKRELFEELNIKVRIEKHFYSTRHQYDLFEINLIAYFAEIEIGTILTYEHKQVDWFAKSDLSKLDWAPADIPIVKKLINSNYLR